MSDAYWIEYFAAIRLLALKIGMHIVDVRRINNPDYIGQVCRSFDGSEVSLSTAVVCKRNFDKFTRS